MVKEPICTNVRAALYQKYSQGANDLGPSLVPPSGMGKQPLSVKPSAAKAVFGTSKRDALTLQPGRDSPAPNAYGTPSMMGKLGASTGSKYRRSAAQVKFGTATRDAGTVKSITAGPGPVPVDYLRARPQTADSTRRNAPKFSIPKNTVKPKATTTTTPAPNAYGPTSSIGRQTLSRNASSPVVGFGTSTRDEKPAGADTPGPPPNFTTFTERPSTANSRLRNAPRFGFGTSKSKTPSKAWAPGPKYLLPEGVGKQSTSTRRSAPMFGIGTAARDGGRKAMQSPGPGAYKTMSAIGPKQPTLPSSPSMSFGTGKERQAPIKSANSPAPNAYQSKSMLGKVPMSTKRSNPSFVFGIGRAEADKYIKPASAKGPTFTGAPGMGKQSLSIKRSASTTVIGSAQRFPDTVSKHGSPGPGSYKTPSAIGRQASSTRASQPTPVFAIGRAERDRKEKGRGRDTPGPSAVLMESTGKQSVSTKRTMPRTRIGTAARFANTKRNAGPGPGSYGTAASIGKQSLSIRKTAKSFTFGSR